MNLIVNKPLGVAQRQLIYELTLKKRRSKKSTMSEKQLAARRQLARELAVERREPSLELDFRDAGPQPDASPDTSLLAGRRLGPAPDQQHPDGCPCDHHCCQAADLAAAHSSLSLGPGRRQASGVAAAWRRHALARRLARHHSDSLLTAYAHDDQHEASLEAQPAPAAHQAGPPSAGASAISRVDTNSSCHSGLWLTCGCGAPSGFGRSDSSYSAGSSLSGRSAAGHTSSESSSAASSVASAAACPHEAACPRRARQRKRDDSIKLKGLHLEQLNGELERRIHEYEYLVGQEKALLGAGCSSREGVNNFHLYDALTSPAN